MEFFKRVYEESCLVSSESAAIIPTFGLAYIVDKVFIQASGLACEVYVEVSPLRFLPITVCEI